MTRATTLMICLAAGAVFSGLPANASAGDGTCSVASAGKVYGDVPGGSNPQPFSNFGNATAVDADVAVIGAFLSDSGGQDVGQVSMYRYNGNSWVIESQISPQPSTLVGLAGTAVAISDGGTVAIAGGQFSSASGQPASGAAWVFRYVPENQWWVQEALLLPSDPQTNDLFGFSVASAGTWAVIGAPQALNNGPGKAYIFTNNWTQFQTLTAPDGAPGDHFGISVAQSNDVIVVGADNDDDNGADSGSVYVYRASSGTVNFEAKLKAPDGFAGQVFGHAVDVLGDTILVGAHGGGAGRVYAYRFDGANWNWEDTLTPDDGAAVDLFGFSVSLDADCALIGAVLDDHSGQTDAGSAYVFRRNGNDWTQCTKITASDAAANDTFGRSVALSGTHVVIGADQDDDFGNSSGSAYMYELDRASVPDCPPSGGDYLASTYKLIGDANGTPWSWEIRFSDASIPPLQDLNVPGVAPGGTAFDVALAFQASIEAARDARGCTPEEIIVDVRSDFGPVFMTIAAGGGVSADLWVGPAGGPADCEVSFLLPACSFNPTIEDLLIDATDCNANGWADVLDIASGTSNDDNGNGVPDECEACGVADIAAPFGILDLADISLFINGFTSQNPVTDMNGDDIFDLTDVNMFISAFIAGCA